MPDLLSNFLSTAFIPHGHCYLWKPGLVWLHLASDALTAMAYYSVAIAIVYFRNERKDLPAKTVTLLTGYFFVFALCGSTHLMGVVTLWYPIYWFSGLLKAFNRLSPISDSIASKVSQDILGNITLCEIGAVVITISFNLAYTTKHNLVTFYKFAI